MIFNIKNVYYIATFHVINYIMLFFKFIDIFLSNSKKSLINMKLILYYLTKNESLFSFL